MEILVYDRANNKVIKEEIRKSLNFLYNTIHIFLIYRYHILLMSQQ